MSVEVNGLANVISNLKSYVQRLTGNAEVAAQEIAALLETYAKANHPWQNRTGDTERTTKAEVQAFSRDAIKIVLTAGTSYAEFLEWAHSGQWAWLWPAVLANEAEIKRILIGRLKQTRPDIGVNF